jgi:vacuolar-type H+-ATPase subunit C/Vma6
MENKEGYQIDFDNFLAEYKRSQVSGEEVGELIVRMAQHFAYHNMKLVVANRHLALVSKDIENRVDENGKSISSSKAKVFADSTQEAYDYEVAKAHVQNIEQIINSLKSLQKGILNEFSHMGN